MRKVFAAIVLLGGTGLGMLMAHASYQQEQRFAEKMEERLTLQRRREAWESLKRELWSDIRNFHGEAGVLVEDLRTGWKAGHQPAHPFPAASVVKVAILAACFGAVQQGRMDLSQTVTLRGKDKVLGSGELKAVPNGTVFTVEQLMRLMITQSDNTAANLLVDLLGFDDLNRSFERMGLKQTRLSRKMMDFASRRMGVENTTTAEDMALVLRKLYHRELVSPEVSERCLALLKRQAIHDRIPAGLPPEAEVANKTGLERGVCHDLGIVFAPQGDFLICVLTRHHHKNSRPAKRFIAQLAQRVYHYTEAQR